MKFITSNYLTLMVASNRSLVNRYSEIQSLKQFRKTHNITRTDNVSGIDDTRGGGQCADPETEAKREVVVFCLLRLVLAAAARRSAVACEIYVLDSNGGTLVLSLYQLFLSQMQHDESSAPRRPGPRRRQSVDRCWAIEWDVRTAARECGDDGTLEKILF